MSVSIRPCRDGDGDPLYEVWMAVREHNAGIDPRVVPAPVSRREFVAGFADVLRRPEATAFVAHDDAGPLVGFITASIEANQPDRLPERHATIGYLYVDPARRRERIGQRLFEAVAAWAAKQDGVSHFEMAVLAADEAAAAFWRSIGFSTFIERLWAPLATAGDNT